MKRVILFSIVGVATAAYAKSAVVVGFGKAEQKEFVLDADPSMVAVSNEFPAASAHKPYKERWRIVSDLNGDGVDDLILSDPQDMFGNAGGPWMVYLHNDGAWHYIGDVGFCPGVVTLEATKDGVNIWNYCRNSARGGNFGYYHVANGKLNKQPMQMHVVSTDEENSIFSRIDMAIFGYPSSHPFRLEESSTSTNGVVSWKKIRDHRIPSRRNEIYELRQKLADAERRASVVEAKLQRMSHRLYEYEHSVHQLCGITLGSAWDGGEKNRPCEEVFSGFTNLTVSVDGNNFVEAIRLTRNDAVMDSVVRPIRGGFEPTDEEQKIIHQVENLFKIRFQPSSDKGAYSWGGPISGTWIDIHFANEGESESYIEMRYSRKFGK